MDKIEGVLYSDNYSFDDLTLKKAILTFDRLRILDPNKHSSLVPMDSIRDTYIQPNGQSITIALADYGALVKEKGERSKFDHFCEEIKYAIKKGVIIPVDPMPILHEKARILRLTYDVDLSNIEIMKIASEGLNQIILNGNNFINIESSGGVLHGMAIAPKGVKSLWNSLPAPTNVPFEAIQDNDLKESIKLLSWTRITKVLTALMVADKYKASPITNSSVLNKLVLYKYKWLAETNNDEIKSQLNNTDKINAFKYQLFASAIISDIFTDEELVQIPLKKLILYKQASDDECKKFKSKILQLSSLIENNVWDDQLNREITKFVSKDILPQIQAYIDAKLELKDRFIGTFIKGVPAALENTLKLAIPIEAAKQLISYVGFKYLIPGFDIPEILLFSGLFAANLIRSSISELVDNFIRKRKNKRENCLTYLLNLKKM